MRVRIPEPLPELNGLGLPDDLPETALAHTPGPDPAAAERIRARAIRLAMTDPGEPLRSSPPAPHVVRRRAAGWMKAVAAVVALVILATAVPPVRAAIKELLKYVPGFGAGGADTIGLAAAHPVEAEQNGITLVVRGLLVDDKSTTVALSADGPANPSPETTYLEDAQGRRYACRGGFVGTSAAFMQGWLTFEPLPTQTDKVTLIVPGEPGWRLEVPLVSAANLTALEQFGQTTTAAGVTMAARAQYRDGRADVTLLFQGLPSGMILHELGRYMGESPVTRVAELVTVDGRRLPLHTAYSPEAPLRDLSADGVTGDRATISVPLLTLRKSFAETVSVPIPAFGAPATLSIPLRVDRWTAHLTRAEVIEETPGEPGTRVLRVWVDLGPSGAYTLTNLRVSSINGQPCSAMGEMSAETGRLAWFSVALPSGQDAVVGFDQLEAELAGPWEVSVPLDR